MVSSFKAKKEKNAVLNACLKWLLRIICLALAANFLLLRTAAADSAVKAAQCTALFALSFLPRLVKMQHLPSAAFFYLFLLLAGVGGAVLGLYDRFRFYDVFTHFLSGGVCVLFLKDFLLIHRIHLARKQYTAAALLFTLSLAAGWEMYEFVVFSVLKNTAFSLHTLAGELGIPAAAQTAATFIQQNLSHTRGSIEGFIVNEYDTFCDILCALAGAVPAAVFLNKQ